MKTNIFTKILALSIFIVATFFGFLTSPASAEAPASDQKINYHSTRISDADRNIINPILDKNCGKLNLGGTNIVMGDCSWFRNTFYLYKYLGQGGFEPELLPSPSSSNEIKLAWEMVRDLYGQFDRSNNKNGFQYIKWKLNPDPKAQPPSPYVDQRTACEIDPTGVGCDQPPSTVPSVCDEVQERSGVFLLYTECAPSDVYAELSFMTETSVLTGAVIGSNYLSVPKELAITPAMSGTFGSSGPWYFAWWYLKDFYYGVSLKTTGGNHDSALQSFNRIKAELEKAQTPTTTTPSLCTGEAAPGSGTSTFYKTVSGGPSIPGVTSAERFVVCYATDPARIGSATIDKIKSVPSTSQYYLSGANYLILPKNMTTFVFNPTDQAKEISAWGGVIDAYSGIESSAKTQGKYVDEVSAQTSILNIRASIATGSKLAFTVSSDEKYFIVSPSYISETILAAHLDYLKTNLIKLNYPDLGHTGVLRKVNPWPDATVPKITTDLQAEAVRSAQNLYIAIRNAAPAYDNTNYTFAEQAQLNLGTAIDNYYNDYFSISPISELLGGTQIDSIKANAKTSRYLTGDTLLVPRVMTAADIGAISDYPTATAWLAVSSAYQRYEMEFPTAAIKADCDASIAAIKEAVEKFTGTESAVVVAPSSATVDQTKPLTITFRYVNNVVMGLAAGLRFKVWVTNVDEKWLSAPHFQKDFPTGQSGDISFDWIWETSANTWIGSHLIRADAFPIDSAGNEFPQIATGSAKVTVLIEGQSDVKWSFDPSQEIKLGDDVTISYTITGHVGQTAQLYITDCDISKGYPKGPTVPSITDGMTGSFTWETTAETGVCPHKLGLTMGPTAKSNSCVEVYALDGAPTGACTGIGEVPVTPPPTGGTTEVEGGQFLEIVGAWLGRAVGQPLKATTVRAFLIMVIEYWFPILIGFASFIGIVVGGLQYISSAGDDAKAEKGKKTLIYSAVGIVLAILSVVIVQAVIGQINKDF